MPALGGLGKQAEKQADWRAFVITRLPPELAREVTGVAQRDDQLTIFTSSAAWASRLQYSLDDLEPAVREREPAIVAVRVKVSPLMSRG